MLLPIVVAAASEATPNPAAASPVADVADAETSPTQSLAKDSAAISDTETATDAALMTLPASPFTTAVTLTETLSPTSVQVAALLGDLAVDAAADNPLLPAPNAEVGSPLAVLLTAVAAPVDTAGAELLAAETPAPSTATVGTLGEPAAAADSEIVDALIVDDANSTDLVTPTLQIDAPPLENESNVVPDVAAEPATEPAVPIPPLLSPPPMPAVNRALLPGDGVARTAEVPVLMYHYLSEPPADANIYRTDLSVAPNRFVEHLDALRGAGYTTISLYDLYNHLAVGAPLPERPVLLTFDDGYRDNYVNAFPRLRERGMTATFFVVTDFIDAGREAYITWEMAREMQNAGMYIESHGRDHTTLQNRGADYLVWQALGSMETIQFELGVAPRFVSYPAGEYDDTTVDVFRSAGYVAGFTTRQGDLQSSDDPFRLPRIRIRNTTTAAELLTLLELDWSSVEEEE